MDSESGLFESSVGASEETIFSSNDDESQLMLSSSATVSKSNHVFGESTTLQRNVGLVSAIALIVGTTIGSGIFVTPGNMLEYTGSVWLSLVIWLTCGMLSMLGALSYIELASVCPKNGGEYTYLMAAFGPCVAFLFMWTSTLVLKPASVAIISLAFAEYAVAPFLDVTKYEWLTEVVAAILIVVIVIISCVSTEFATTVQNVLTATKLVAVLVIVVSGGYNLCIGKTENLNFTFEGSNWGVGALALATYQGLWAFDGWNNLNYVIEELKHPYRNLPLAIIVAIPLVTLCYISLIVAFLTVLTPQQMMESTAVAVDYGNGILGWFAFLMPLSVVLSTFGSANGTHFAAGRLGYAAAREGHLLRCMSYVHVKRKVPTVALIFNGLISLLLALTLPIGRLIDSFGFAAWIFYGATAATVIRLRYTLPNAPRPFKVPLVIPATVSLMSIFLIGALVVDKPQWQHLYIVGFIFGGLLFYMIFIRFRNKMPGRFIQNLDLCVEALNNKLQKVLHVVPVEEDQDVAISKVKSKLYM